MKVRVQPIIVIKGVKLLMGYSRNSFECPLPSNRHDRITINHGAGGKLMRDLIRDTIGPMYAADFRPDHDGAILDLDGRLAFTSDSFVVQPLEFPGGDIGKLAIYGTVNDLLMCGAKPLYLSTAFIIEEGFPLATLERICRSMAHASQETGVAIVTGDTKVVGKGQADGLFINTSGVGRIPLGLRVHPLEVMPGDKLIVTGDLGRHAVAIMAARTDFILPDWLVSDCAPLSEPIDMLLMSGVEPRCLRDLTRVGLAAALHEIATVAQVGLDLDESLIPVHDDVRSICEIMGFDPLYLANEGRCLIIVRPEDVEESIKILQNCEVSQGASVIGTVTPSGRVDVMGLYGSRRSLPEQTGEILPRIC